MSHEDGAKFRKLRMARTITQAAAWVCMGLYSEVSSPTLPYLKDRVDSNYEQISRALVSRSFGFLAGAVTGGFLCDKFYSLTDLWMSISLFLAAGAVTAAPWCSVLWILCIMFFLDGVGKGILAAGGNSLIIKMWGEKASPPTHAIHFSFGVGALIVPQIARLFLPSDGHIQDSNTELNTTTLSPVNMSTTPAPKLDAPIEYPYAIVGAITAFVGLLDLVIFFMRGDTLRNEQSDKGSKKFFRLSNWVQGPKKLLGLLFIFLLFIFWSLPIGAERAYGKFIFAYSTEGPVDMSNNDATIVETLFWATFTAGRGAAIFISKFTPPLLMLVIDLALNLLAGSMLAGVAPQSRTVFWIFNGVFGSVLSPLFPASLAWANFYVRMTAMMTALAFIASAAGAFAFSWMSGYFFEYIGPQSLMYLILGYAIVASVVFLVMYIVARSKGKRDMGGNEKDCQNADDEAAKEKFDLSEKKI